MKKINKKSKRKIKEIADTVYIISLCLVVTLSITTKEYGVGIILLLIEIIRGSDASNFNNFIKEENHLKDKEINIINIKNSKNNRK